MVGIKAENVDENRCLCNRRDTHTVPAPRCTRPLPQCFIRETEVQPLASLLTWSPLLSSQYWTSLLLAVPRPGSLLSATLPLWALSLALKLRRDKRRWSLAPSSPSPSRPDPLQPCPRATAPLHHARPVPYEIASLAVDVSGRSAPILPRLGESRERFCH